MSVLVLKVNHEDMTANLAVIASSPQALASAEAVAADLVKNQVVFGIDKNAIADAFTKLPTAAVGTEFLIARGEPAKHGKNGFLDFKINVSGKPIYDGAKIDDGKLADLESVDYKNAMRIVSVKAGEVLAKVIPPTVGVEGKSLTGKVLAARDGKAVPVILGEGTAFAPNDTSTIVATCDGRPVHNGKAFSVTQTYEIAGDVGFDTGNIKFDGYVAVRGGVKDDFSIEAKNIEIDGVIGAAKLICGGNLIAHGGINGRGKATIVCGGSLDAKYLINCAKIEIGGDVNVAKEISNSTVWSRGAIRAGKIMNGETLAQIVVEAKQIGSEIGAPTAVTVGVNYEIRRIDDTMRIFCNNIWNIVDGIGTKFGDHKWFLGLPPAKQEELQGAYRLFTKLKDARNKLEAARKIVAAREGAAPKSSEPAMVIALKFLYPDVTIRTATTARRFMELVRGPMLFTEDVENKSIKYDHFRA